VGPRAVLAPLTTEAIQNGDPAAFARLFEENRPKLLAIAYRLTSSAAEAEDVVQDAFMSSWRHRAQFAGEARPSMWLYRVTFNAALMRLRTRRRKGAESLDALAVDVAEAVVARAREERAPPSPDARVHHDDDREAIEAALSTLLGHAPPRARPLPLLGRARGAAARHVEHRARGPHARGVGQRLALRPR
jgi:RNA polymerase sigma-70 factor (ECF subfamily)